MRKATVALVALLAVAAAGAAHGTTTAGPGPLQVTCTKSSMKTVSPGVLTIGTDNPAYGPWYAGGTPRGSSWKLNDPGNGKGYEPAVAYAVASKLGFTHDQVKWIYVPFNRAYAPGTKPFDFDINQISYNPARAKQVGFSTSYYDVNQAIVVLKGTPISRVRTRAGLKDFKLGAQLGTTSYGYITSNIHPTKSPAVFPQNAAAVEALKNKQIDGLVVDLPTAFYVTSAQVPNSEVLGQFPAPAGGEHFGMVFTKGNPIVTCVDVALGSLTSSGTLKALQQQWLSKATGAPVLK